MLRSIVSFSVRRKPVVMFGVLLLIAGGFIALSDIPIDAVPDITNNQVQVITVSNGLPAEDMERFITFPVERLMANLPNVVEVRSISRFGLSLVTVVFEEKVPTMKARQLVGEQIALAGEDIPAAFGHPEMMPITTGLGEIYQYTLEVDPEYAHLYDPMKLRTIQDWLVKRKLTGIEGVIEISSFGGLVKQYEVGYHPDQMAAMGITTAMLAEALEKNNANIGGGYINEGNNALYIRTDGLLSNPDDVGRVRVTTLQGIPVLVSDIATVKDGPALRYGALTKDGKGEAVGGIVLLLKDANAKATVERVQRRVAKLQQSLPEGITIVPYLDRSILVKSTIHTAVENLAIAGLVVGLVLIFFLGNYKAGLLAASIIPLSMLFALIMMRLLGVSANLMSLGAVDLGIVVDGAVIVVEGVLHTMALLMAGTFATRTAMDKLVVDSTVQIYKSAAFGVLIILVVFFPILYLGGIEGKMFRPMALTLVFALAGALMLSVTYIPAAAAVLLRGAAAAKPNFGERLVQRLSGSYRRWLLVRIGRHRITFTVLIVLLGFTIWRAGHLGAVFVPDLEEGDLAMQMAIPSGSNLERMVTLSTQVERKLMNAHPEITSVVSKIGTAEVPTDPMAIEDADVMILLKPKSEWTTASTRAGLVEAMQHTLEIFPEVAFEFSQPIQLRFNELISGTKADIAVKIFGPDNAELHDLGEKAEAIIKGVAGADDVKLERTEGLGQYVIRPNRERLAHFGLNVDDVNLTIQSAIAGIPVGHVYEGEQRFDMVVRLNDTHRSEGNLTGVLLATESGHLVPLSEVVDIERGEGQALITREQAQRRISVGVNVRNRSLTEVVADMRTALERSLILPPGYSLSFEGEFRNYEEAVKRLSLAVPASLFIILLLLYFTFDRWRHALMVFSLVPFTTLGGIWALSLRGMPFSISAGIGFIALFGVGVLNSIVLLSHINHMRQMHPDWVLGDAVAQAAADRFRPVMLTSITTILGFLPMALSTNIGAEVQRPLATVVVGGLLINMFLTLVYLPKLYHWLEGRLIGKWVRPAAVGLLLLCGSIMPYEAAGQARVVSWDEFHEAAVANNPNLSIRDLNLEIEKMRTGENWLLSPTRLDYGYGQINETPTADDYQWLFTQEFGSIPEHIYRGKRQNARIEATEAEVLAFRQNFEADLKAAYLRWVVAFKRLEAATAYIAQLDTLFRRVEAQAQAGDISDTEKYFFEAEVLRSRREHASLAVALTEVQLDLERQCQFALTGTKPFEDEAFGVMQPVPDTLFTERYYKAQEARIAESAYLLKMQQSAFFPSLSAGYQKARLEGLSGADAYFVGVAFPLWYGPDRSRSRQAGISLAQEQVKLDAVKFTVDTEARQTFDAYLTYRTLFEANAANFADKARNLSTRATGAYRTGETTVYQLHQALAASFRLQLEYLGLAEDYGNARIQLIRYQAP